MQLQLNEIALATANAVNQAPAASGIDAARGVRILEALATALGPHTAADLKQITTAGNAVKAQVILKDLSEALDVILTTQ